MTYATVSATPDIGLFRQHAWQPLREQKPGVRVHDAATIALFYGQRNPGQSENPAWRARVTILPTAGMTL